MTVVFREKERTIYSLFDLKGSGVDDVIGEDMVWKSDGNNSAGQTILLTKQQKYVK